MIPPLLWAAVLAVSWALFGLIWTVQLVHYPSFRYVPDFGDFHAHHTGSISLVVGPLMVAELAVAGWLAYRTASWLWIVPLLVVLLIWAFTFFYAVPLHNRLGVARDDAVIESLIRINWPRTLLWTFKAIWVTVLFVTASR